MSYLNPGAATFVPRRHSDGQQRSERPALRSSAPHSYGDHAEPFADAAGDELAPVGLSPLLPYDPETGRFFRLGGAAPADPWRLEFVRIEAELALLDVIRETGIAAGSFIGYAMDPLELDDLIGRRSDRDLWWLGERLAAHAPDSLSALRGYAFTRYNRYAMCVADHMRRRRMPIR